MADFVIGSDGSVMRTGLPALRPQAGVPATIPFNAPTIGGQNFTMGAGGRPFTIDPRAPKMLPPPSAAQLPVPYVSPAANAAASKFSLGGAAKMGLKGAGAATLGLGLADAAIGRDPTEGEFSAKGENVLRDVFGEGLQGLYDTGVSLKSNVGSTETSPAGDFIRTIAGETLQSPARVTAGVKDISSDPLGSVVKLAEKGAKSAEGFSRFMVEDVIQERLPILNELILPRNKFTELEQKKFNEQYLPKLVQNEQDKAAVNDIATEMFMQTMGGGGTTARMTEPMTIGTIQFPSAPQLPPPPPAADFTEVYRTLQKTMPQDPNTQDFQTQSTIAVLAGMMSGVLKMRDGDLGSMLLGAGIGGLAGRASIDQAKADAQARFKDQLDQYHLKLASVQRDQAETEADYAHRVWENNNANLLRAYNVANEKASLMNQKVTQGQDGQLLLTSIRDNGDGTGTREFRVYQPGTDTDTTASMLKLFKPLVGKEKAETIISQIHLAKTPEKAMGLYILSLAKANGQYEKLLNNIEQASPDFVKEYGKIGSRIQGVQAGKNETERGEMIQNERDAFLIDVIMNSPRLLGMAGDTVGLTVPQGGR